MWKGWKMVLLIAAMFAAGAIVGTAAPKSTGSPNGNADAKETVEPAAQKSTGSPNGAVNSKENSVAAGEDCAERLLLLMDRDKSGKVSKQEFMSFMEAEFDRLDTNKNGELDLQELAKMRIRSCVGK